MNEPLYLIGAGSLGLLLAARLSPVEDVRLLRRELELPATLEFELEAAGEITSFELPQYTPSTLPGTVRRAIVCTKAYDALPALAGLGDALATDARLLLMQNGMGSQQAIAAAFPGANVYAATTTEGANRPKPRRVVHAGNGVTRIGRLAGAEADWLSPLRAAGFAAEAVGNIDWHLAAKLRINALINPLTVLFGVRNGELLAEHESREQMRRLGLEADEILAAAGFRFDTSAFDAAIEVCFHTALNVSSMLQDARFFRRLEIDHINGYLLRLADEHGIDAPANREIVERLSKR